MDKPGDIKHGREVWIGVDFDGTLAKRKPGDSHDVLGPPIYKMVTQVKRLLRLGWKIKIFTARVSAQFPDRIKQHTLIGDWCVEHLGKRLEATCEKDGSLVQLWDDRAISVFYNSGDYVSASELFGAR